MLGCFNNKWCVVVDFFANGEDDDFAVVDDFHPHHSQTRHDKRRVQRRVASLVGLQEL